MAEPWELTLERALLSRLPPAPSADEHDNDDDDDVSIEQNAEDRAARLDELMALSSIYGENLRSSRRGCAPATTSTRSTTTSWTPRFDSI
jgi:hypothetical protein